MPLWYEREQPLARCPLLKCRRSNSCGHSTEEDPCRRHYMTQEQAYTLWAYDINRRCKEMIANRPPGEVVEVAEPGTPLFEQRLSLLYRLLRERDQENSANEMAELARRRGGAKKPATAPGDG